MEDKETMKKPRQMTDMLEVFMLKADELKQ